MVVGSEYFFTASLISSCRPRYPGCQKAKVLAEMVLSMVLLGQSVLKRHQDLDMAELTLFT